MGAIEGKPVWESKTLWFNFLGLIVVVLQYAGTIHIGDPKFIEGILGVVNLVLRFYTSEPVKV